MNALATRLLASTSRTFIVPIMRMPGELRSATGSAYLCMRAIDEIEDHPGMPAHDKQAVLLAIAALLIESTGDVPPEAFDEILMPHRKILPEVSLKLGWLLKVAPISTRNLIATATGEMSREMADWVRRGWNIESEKDLDKYTFDVAGRVGIMLSELWRWYDAIETSREEAIGFGRGLQTVNILRNRDEDAKRNVNYYPRGWERSRMMEYANRQLTLADRYIEKLPRGGAAYNFCTIPLALARATLSALEEGKQKLSRGEVMKVIASCAG